MDQLTYVLKRLFARRVVLLAALTLKHRVGLTGANTLEGYAHPRMLAFAIGVTSVTYVLRGRPAAALKWGTKIEHAGVMDLVTVEDAIAAFERYRALCA